MSAARDDVLNALSDYLAALDNYQAQRAQNMILFYLAGAPKVPVSVVEDAIAEAKWLLSEVSDAVGEQS